MSITRRDETSAGSREASQGIGRGTKYAWVCWTRHCWQEAACTLSTARRKARYGEQASSSEKRGVMHTTSAAGMAVRRSLVDRARIARDGLGTGACNLMLSIPQEGLPTVESIAATVTFSSPDNRIAVKGRPQEYPTVVHSHTSDRLKSEEASFRVIRRSGGFLNLYRSLSHPNQRSFRPKEVGSGITDCLLVCLSMHTARCSVFEPDNETYATTDWDLRTSCEESRRLEPLSGL